MLHNLWVGMKFKCLPGPRELISLLFKQSRISPVIIFVIDLILARMLPEDDIAEKMDQLFEQYQKKNQATGSKSGQMDQSRKKKPDEAPKIIKAAQEMEVETKKVHKLKFHELPDEILMYLVEIYPFGNKLFLTGIMDNGQTLSVVASDLYKQIYFVLKNQSADTDGMTPGYLRKAEDEIKHRLRSAGLAEGQYYGEMVEMQYVFQIREIPRNKRPYYKVRYNMKEQLHEQIEPDWEGETFKYVIGTSYTPLELLIVNKRIKGPCWVKINKTDLKDNEDRNIVLGSLCVDIKFPEVIEVVENRTEPPTVRVMSFSIKQIIPSTISKKKYFNKDKDDSQIYAISYHYCPDYRVSIKDPKPQLIHHTYYLGVLGSATSNEFTACVDENNIIARFESDIIKYDPDFIVCHDASKILDSLICRISKIDKNSKVKFSRLKTAYNVSKTNQTQRINTFIAGRLLVDTYFHSKDMVKSIEYDLQTMATFARPNKKFSGISDEEAKIIFNEEKPFALVNKCRDESELTFEVMNHFELLQMTRQLSNICGNLWKRSLENKRAERNQFLIMHECRQRALIIPDKFRREKGEDEETEAKKKYQGGMVFQPEKGFYSDFILLLDFNSLYPSIIREYNVCFSIIDRPKLTLDFYYKPKNKKREKKEKTEMVAEENPEDDGLEEMFANTKSCPNKSDWGFLPILIDNIVEQRKKCKKKMKKATNPVDIMILDIQQKCYKVVANSIYGCLGFSVSRFYSRPLAALITKKGRDSLMAAKDIVAKKGGVRVIYGDTDSLMIEPTNFRVDDNATDIDKLKSLKKIADELRVQINSKYTALEIEIDGIFKPLILLMKKKYVANKLKNFDQIILGLSNEPKYSLEFKGIETVRRDGCKLARDTLQKVINILVSQENQEIDTRYQKIIDLFTDLNASINKEPLQSLLFSKQLTKKPKEYTNAEHLPHVKVANDRLKAGEKEESLVNHTIYYLICLPKDNNNALAHNAYDLKTFKRVAQFEPNNKLEIDYDYYKSEVVQPVGRLLANINDKIYDQIVKILGISARRVKNVKELLDDEGQVVEPIGEAMGNNLKARIKQLRRELGDNITCTKCDKQYVLFNELETKQFLQLGCPFCHHNNVNSLYNRIRYKMKLDETSYYNNRRRCTCTKTYELTNIVPCCDLERKAGAKKSEISFKLHNFLYLVKDICSVAMDKDADKPGHIEAEKLTKITNMIEEFLRESEYEKTCDALQSLKL